MTQRAPAPEPNTKHQTPNTLFKPNNISILKHTGPDHTEKTNPQKNIKSKEHHKKITLSSLGRTRYVLAFGPVPVNFEGPPGVLWREKVGGWLGVHLRWWRCVKKWLMKCLEGWKVVAGVEIVCCCGVSPSFLVFFWGEIKNSGEVGN